MTEAEAVLAAAWRKGVAWHHPDVCDAGQRSWLRRLDEDVRASRRAAHVWRVARQRGKSHAALAYALSEMVRRPGLVVRYAGLTAKSAAAIVTPTLRRFAAQLAASGLAVDVREDRGVATIRNSVLTWAGTDNEQFDRLRGPYAHLILLDESGFYADLPGVESALLPQLTTTNGVVVYLSTPSESPSHPWVQRAAAARAQGREVHATVHDSPRLGPGGVAALEASEAARLGLSVETLRVSTYWRREYLAEVVLEESRAALPAWTEAAQHECIRDVPRPQRFDAYVAADWSGGTGDPTALLFARLDYPSRLLVVEDEVVLPATATLRECVDALRQREAQHWGVSRWDGTLAAMVDWRDVPEYLQRYAHRGAPQQPHLRVADAPDALLREVAALGVGMVRPEKADKPLAVDAVNDVVAQRRVAIHPRCANLLRQMASTLWNARRTGWERQDSHHGDCLDALVYLVRSVRWHRQPSTPEEATAAWEAAFSRRRRAC